MHYLAADAAVAEDAAMARKAPLLYLGSLLIAGLQSMATAAVMVGSIHPSCSSTDQCPVNHWCAVGESGRCSFCNSGSAPVADQNLDNLTLVADVCATPYTGSQNAPRTLLVA